MSYQPRVVGARVTCPCCSGSGQVQVCPDDTIPGAGTVADICKLCGETGWVTFAQARRYLIVMSDYAGLDALRTALDAAYGQRGGLIIADSSQRRGERSGR
jgi:hypothetical protein